MSGVDAQTCAITYTASSAATVFVFSKTVAPTGVQYYTAGSGSYTMFFSPTPTTVTYNTTTVVGTATSYVLASSSTTNFFGAMILSGLVTQASISGSTGITASTLTVGITFTSVGPRTAGQVVISQPGLSYLRNWKYYRPSGGFASSGAVSVAIIGTFVNGIQQALQFGAGAGTGNIQDTSLGMSYTWRLGAVTLGRGSFGYRILSSCGASLIHTLSDSNNGAGSGAIPFAMGWIPPLRRRTVQYQLLNIDTVANTARINGLDTTVPPNSYTNNIINLKMLMVDNTNANDKFLSELWFQGLSGAYTDPYNVPINPFGVASPATNWQFYRLISGTLDHYTDNSGYWVNNMDQPINPFFKGVGLLPGPAFQLGPGAGANNTLVSPTTTYGGYFPGLYQFQYGSFWNPGNISVIVN